MCVNVVVDVNKKAKHNKISLPHHVEQTSIIRAVYDDNKTY